MNAQNPLNRTRGHRSPLLLAVAVACALAQAAMADLTHRYSFEADATDSVGGANGTLMNGATISGGAVAFSGAVASGATCDYVALPPGLISNYTSVTFEFWLDAGVNGIWPEVFAFGKQNAGGAGANMVMFCPHSGSAPNDYRMSYAQASPGYTDEYVLNGVGVLDSLGPLCVTCVFDPPNNSMAMYTNGSLVALKSPVTRRFSLTNVHNVYSWLGRSLYNGDASYAGTLDEFRIYNTALGPLQIAVNAQAGPNTIVTNIAVSSITWSVKNNMIIGEQQDTSVTFNTANYGSVTAAGSTEATYTSSDPATIAVDIHGRLLALALGSAAVSASYGSTTNSVQVTVGPPVIVHRYSFTADASDSVGGANGTLVNGAAIANGAVVLTGTGTSATAEGGYVDLPNDLLTNLSTASIETWCTDNGSAAWARVWDLGNASAEDVSDTGSRYMFLSLPNGSGVLQGTVRINDRAGGDLSVIWNGGRPPVGKRSHIVFITSIAAQMAWLYVDGALVGQTAGFTLKPSDIGHTLNDWLGRSQYGADGMFNGTIDEFRIWSGAMPPFQIAVDAASGPDKLVTDPGAIQTVTLTVNTNMVKGGLQNASVTGDFANVTGVNLTSVGAVYSSGNTNILIVDAGGQITAVALGTTTITASYGGKSDTRTITVAVKPTVLAHRWSFNETTGTSAADSVGSATGTLSPTATFASGAVSLNGLDAYVDLPGHLFDGFDAVTFEAWAKINSGTLNDSNARLYEFGSTDRVNEVGLTARTGGQNTFLRYFGPVTVTTLQGGHLALDQQLHIVGIFNPPQNTIDLFVNGSWQNSATNVGFSLASITNLAGRLGANLGGTNFTAADINEFRIYNGGMDLLGIRASLAAGPDKVVSTLGSATALTLKANANMVQGSRALPHVRASFADVSDVDLTDTGAATFTSSDPSVLTITADGLVQATGSGSATLTATYAGKSDSKVITVYPKQAMLVNRYSFTNDVSDSVGAQDGVLWGNAQVADGKVTLLGDPTYKNSYVELPRRLISSYDAVTMECWMTMPTTVGTWARIYDFGSQTSGASGYSYIFLTRSGIPTTRTVLASPGPAEAMVESATTLLDGFSGQMVVVYDSVNNRQALYANGALVISGDLGGKTMADVNDLHCWLGKSLYSGDSGLSGDIDEFRIYAGALTDAQIAASYTAGPNKVALPAPIGGGPKLAVRIEGGNIVIAWPTSATGLHPETSPALGTAAAWTQVTAQPVVVGNNYELTIPVGQGAAFYRLRQ